MIKNEVETDCIRFFIKGLGWGIRIRIGNPKNWNEAREQALTMEREFSPAEELEVEEIKPETKGV